MGGLEPVVLGAGCVAFGAGRRHDPPLAVNPLIRFIPAFLVRFFASPYVAGDSLEQALQVVQKLFRERGLLATLDLLAEDIRTVEQAQRNLDVYLRMVDAAAASGLSAEVRPTLSLKPSSYTTSPLHEGGDAAGSFEAIRRIAERAGERSVGLSIDMEGRHWTDFTLDTLRRLHADGHRHVGAVDARELIAVEHLAPARAHRLVSHEQHRVAFIGQRVHEVVQDTTTGRHTARRHDDRGVLRLLDRT